MVLALSVAGLFKLAQFE